MSGAGVQRSEETLEKLSKWQASPLANACSLPVNPLLSVTQCVTHGPRAPSESLLEMQHFRPHSSPAEWKPHFNKAPRRIVCTSLRTTVYSPKET